MRVRSFIALALALSLVFLAWAPWESGRGYAAQAEVAFAAAWEGIVDGCGMDCTNCGARLAVRIPFGYLIDLEFACGMIPADLPEYHQRATVLVTIFGTVHGIPGP